MKNKLNDTQLQNDETMASFDITSLYTNIPINMALGAVEKELTADPELTHRTKLLSEEFILGIQLCLTSTIFRFQGKIYRQIDGVAVKLFHRDQYSTLVESLPDSVGSSVFTSECRQLILPPITSDTCITTSPRREPSNILQRLTNRRIEKHKNRLEKWSFDNDEQRNSSRVFRPIRDSSTGRFRIG
ncbi:unnamed protein product [Trichobilharzia regenti]|nr:unnamed protein product [Trichobilharzia regenti]